MKYNKFSNNGTSGLTLAAKQGTVQNPQNPLLVKVKFNLPS